MSTDKAAPIPAAPDETMPEDLLQLLDELYWYHKKIVGKADSGEAWSMLFTEEHAQLVKAIFAFKDARDEEVKRMKHRAEIAERQMHLEHEYYETELARSDRLQRELDELKSESGFAKAIVDNKMKDELEVVRSGRDLMARAVKERDRILLGQFADVQPGDFVKCRVTLGDSEGIVKDVVPTHRMIRLQSGWCLHQNDKLIEHIPSKQHAEAIALADKLMKEKADE